MGDAAKNQAALNPENTIFEYVFFKKKIPVPLTLTFFCTFDLETLSSSKTSTDRQTDRQTDAHTHTLQHQASDRTAVERERDRDTQRHRDRSPLTRTRTH